VISFIREKGSNHRDKESTDSKARLGKTSSEGGEKGDDLKKDVVELGQLQSGGGVMKRTTHLRGGPHVRPKKN